MQTQFDVHKKADKNSQCSYLPLALRKQNLISSAIAMLSDEEIKMMNREDLLDTLRMTRSLWPRSDTKYTEKLDVTELRRLLAIVREYFRTHVNQQSPPTKWSPELN